ncbi:MAG: hypothetical protein KDB80_14585 [Planctomycetes bacterium]|nr:hypothetical protein [Planctomycetota bacterium]
MIRSLALALAFAGASLSNAVAQCTPIPGVGCLGDPPPTCSGPPSSAAGFSLRCGGSPASLPCIAPPVMMIGFCSLPIPILPPLGCSTTCGLVVSPSFGTFPDPTVVGPGLPVGLKLCVQCACIASNAAGALCINLSDGLSVAIVP